MDVIKFDGEMRQKTGKGGARKERAAGFIPAILYGAGVESQNIRVEKAGADKIIRHLATKNVIADLVLKNDGKTETIKTLVKEIQIDPVSSHTLHIDFYRMRMDKAITMTVAVVIVGESLGVKEGGVLDHALREARIEALPMQMPDKIEVDISGLKIGDALLVRDLKLAEGVRIVEDAERAVLSILAPTKEEEPVVAAEAVAAEAVQAEPEVISEEKAEERRKAKEDQKAAEGKAEKTEKTEKGKEKA